MRRTILALARAMAGVSIILTAGLIYCAAYKSFSRSMRNDTAAAALYIAAGLESSGAAYLESLASPGKGELFRGRLNRRVTLIDGKGRVLFDSAASVDAMENHLNRPEIAAALENGAGESLRFSETISRQTYYYALRLRAPAGGDGSPGTPESGPAVLRVSYTTDSVIVVIANLMIITLLIAAVIFILLSLAASRVTKKLVEPINRIDLDNPEETPVYEELTPLLLRIKRQNEAIAGQMRATRKRQLEFEAITGNMREGLIVLDREARILSCNKSARALLDVQLERVENHNFLAIRRDEPFRGAVEKALGGAATEAAFTAGNRRLRLFANPVGDSGTIQGAALVILDVTEGEDRERLRREFTANVSHELKTPLMAISGYAEIMAGGLAAPEDMPRFALKIYGETQRLITLIGDIMTLSKLDEKDEAPLKEKLDLFALTRDVLTRSSAAAAVRNIALSLEGKAMEMTGVRQVLDEMIFNLLDNALKYNVEGGQVRVSLEKRDSEILLSVSDTGSGIPPDEQSRIFERFYRVDKSRSGAIPGTGLGLSIVKHGAALHNAKVEVESDGKTGSRFTLRFPA
ncbi:MAG: PAS domain-containing protein [Treponema sp.]|jgi:two-component system phosphate regulon sensor histidine kinase PhoR|nr:PAS domain-containing protein [Treponema sp.]